VSPADPTRTPKASYRWYSDLVHAGLPPTLLASP
jgi:hypothetical protein